MKKNLISLSIYLCVYIYIIVFSRLSQDKRDEQSFSLQCYDERGSITCNCARSSMTLLQGLFQTFDLRVGRSGTTQLTPGGGGRKRCKKEQGGQKVMSPQQADNGPLGGPLFISYVKTIRHIFGHFQIQCYAELVCFLFSSSLENYFL